MDGDAWDVLGSGGGTEELDGLARVCPGHATRADDEPVSAIPALGGNKRLAVLRAMVVSRMT